jgi:hypothetical protein
LSWTVTLVSSVAIVWWTLASQVYCDDGRAFWTAGRDLWEGRDPYGHPGVLNPPTAFPLFSLLGLLPLGGFLLAWKILGLLGYGLLAPLSREALRPRDGEPPGRMEPSDLGLLSAAVALSVAVRYSIILGQLAFVTTLALIAAVACRSTSRPMLAGFCLAFASIKPPTLLPFLLLLFHRRDKKVWIAMAATGLLLMLVWVSPLRLIDSLGHDLDNIRLSKVPGGVNDYAFTGSFTVDLIGLDHAVYHLGLRDRNLVGVVHLVLVAGLGLWIARQLYRAPALSDSAATVIVACYSAIFLYHRLYDTVILVIPLVYVFSQGLLEPSPLRWVYRACSVGILGVLYEPMALSGKLLSYAQRPGLLNRLVEALVLPLGTWTILGLTIALTVVERKRLEKGQAVHPPSGRSIGGEDEKPSPEGTPRPS